MGDSTPLSQTFVSRVLSQTFVSTPLSQSLSRYDPLSTKLRVQILNTTYIVSLETLAQIDFQK